MEEMLQHGVERVIRELPEKPRMMMIFTSCIHHFMAVNYQRVYKILAKEFPEIDFVDCYMDPIMRRTNPVVPSLWRQMHRVLRYTEEKNSKQVTLLGNCFPHEGTYCDLVSLLEANGIKVLEACSCKDYDEYLAMAESTCNFLFHTSGIAAAGFAASCGWEAGCCAGVCGCAAACAGCCAAGAGCATCLSNTVACLDCYVLLFVKRGKTYVCIKPSMFRPSKQIVNGVCGVGIPASIQNLLNVTGMTILNNFTSAYGSDPVAAMGIAQRVNMVPYQIAKGFSQGIMPLISYNYASGNIKRMKKTFTFTAKISLGFILAVMLTFVVAAEPIISMFMKNESIVAYGAAFLRGFCFALPFLCIDFLALGVFQSCGMGMKSFIFAVVRKIVLEIPALFVLNWLFPLYGLAYAQFVAELILGTIAVVVLVRMFRRLEREHAAPYVSDSVSVK